MREETRQRRNARERLRRKGWQRIITRLGTAHAVACIERGYDSEARRFALNDVMTLCGKRLRLSSQQYLKEAGPLSCAECQFARRAIDTVNDARRPKPKDEPMAKPNDKTRTVWNACFSTICAYREETLVLADVMLNVAKEINRPDLAQMARVIGASLREVATYGDSEAIAEKALAAFEKKLGTLQ